jgi:hypothetical protein
MELRQFAECFATGSNRQEPELQNVLSITRSARPDSLRRLVVQLQVFCDGRDESQSQFCNAKILGRSCRLRVNGLNRSRDRVLWGSSAPAR